MNIVVAKVSVAPVQVRLGATSPALPKADASKVRLGATSPALPKADTSKVRRA